MIEAPLALLGIDPEETKIYRALLESGPTSVGQLARRTNLARPSLYGLLKRLQAKGLVSESLKDNIKIFIAQSPSSLTRLFEEHIAALTIAQTEYQRSIPELEQLVPTRMIRPHFGLYEGVAGVQRVLKDLLLYREIETQAYWPIQTMLDILSPEFFRKLNRDRIRQNIYTRAIWPADQVVDFAQHPYLGSGPGFKREIRLAPPGIKFTMGYWIYQHKVAFISSRAESFGFIIESQELVAMLLSQFEILWGMSKTLTPEPEKTDAFLSELHR